MLGAGFLRDLQTFRHPELLRDLVRAPKVAERDLLNLLNHAHFMDRDLLVLLVDNEGGKPMLRKARPAPCQGETLACQWVDPGQACLSGRAIRYVFLSDGRSLVVLALDKCRETAEGFEAPLPPNGFVVGKRRARRFPGREVVVELMQDSLVAQGTLLDFSSQALRVQISPAPGASLLWLQEERPIGLRLWRENEIVFTGLCRCHRQTAGVDRRELVLFLGRDPGKTPRSAEAATRHCPVPPPNAAFVHPLTGRQVTREVADLGLHGFSLVEPAGGGCMPPGMILRRCTISFAAGPALSCMARLVSLAKEKNACTRCAFEILDMDLRSYGRWSHLLAPVLDPCIRIADDLDLDQLWTFLFETGFVYPKKYVFLQSHRSAFKETYRKVYRNHPEVAEHFTYRIGGQILGHLSMVRAYETAWMVHHLAAKRTGGRRIATALLKQILTYFEGVRTLPSVRLHYLMFYFRPDNRYPNLLGDFSRSLRNPQVCSMDLFAYKEFARGPETDLPADWHLRKCTPADEEAVGRFYCRESGGLLMDVLRPDQAEEGGRSAASLYADNGLFRRWDAYALLQGDRTRALVMVDQSDLGLNLSELLNGMKVLMADEADIPWPLLKAALDRLASVYPAEEVSTMIYPASYLRRQGVPFEKEYLLWILDVQYGPEFISYMRKKFRMGLLLFPGFIWRRWIKPWMMRHCTTAVL